MFRKLQTLVLLVLLFSGLPLAQAYSESECREAQRSYEVESSSIRRDVAAIESYRQRMYLACGMVAPPQAAVPVATQNYGGNNVAQCRAGCGNEQGICLSQCRGGNCDSGCYEAQARCVARCR